MSSNEIGPDASAPTVPAPSAAVSSQQELKSDNGTVSDAPTPTASTSTASASTASASSSAAATKTMNASTVSRFVVLLGAVLTIVPLILTVMVHLDQSQYQIIKIVLALGCAGVAAGIPGIIEANLHNGIKAGGAIAVFVIIYFFSPAALTKSSPATLGPTASPSPAPSVAPTPLNMASLATPFDVTVTSNDTEGLEMRADPQIEHSVILKLAQGSNLTVQGKYKDVGNHRWWPVKIQPGWITDGETDLSKPRMLKRIGGGNIGPNELVEVTYRDYQGIRWRDDPGKDARTIAIVLHGSKMRVMGNSQSKDGYRWWPVRVANGWIPEGPADNPQASWIKPATN